MSEVPVAEALRPIYFMILCSHLILTSCIRSTPPVLHSSNYGTILALFTGSIHTDTGCHLNSPPTAQIIHSGSGSQAKSYHSGSYAKR